MNRWSEAFDTHQFHTFWNSFNKEIESIDLGAEANENIVTEFSRLVKCQKLIDSILNSVDKDTFHLQTLANAQSPVQQANTHLTNFKSDMSNLSQLQAVNSQIDQVLNVFRPYMVMPDAVAKSLKEVSKTQQKLIEQLNDSLVKTSQTRLDELKETLSEAKKYLQEIEGDSEKSNDLYEKLFGDDGSSGLNAEIGSLHKKIQATQSQSTQASQAIQNLEQTASQANTRIERYEASSEQSTGEIEQLLADMEEELKELKLFYLKVFGKPNEEGELIGGMKAELEEYKTAFTEYESEHKSRIEELIKEIESLLPGAVSAGLASEYKKLKDECTDPINKFTNQFYLALTGLLVVGGFSFYYSVANNSGLEFILYNFLQVSPLLLPAVWFAVFTSRRRNELERLRQEYAHKQAVTSSYQSFKEQINSLGEKQPEMLSALMSTAINTIGDNASKVLSNNSKESSPLHETINSIGNGVTKITKGKES